MLKLRNISKQYIVGENTINALRGLDLEFRKSEFVAILGPSGCGKTTLLNIVGGLDQYTTGDLIINNKSTKYYIDSDWDSYRNHTIGFVFQSYNLIGHQTVLGNVELALTLSGISKEERKKRAIEVLESVGLGDQIHKIPNQLSGGQMQRVAIARALVNNPDIILADEPTGALDSETSIQIMELLKEIAKDRLVIMVTHNPDLARKYANRTIRLLDGSIIDDTNPFNTSDDNIIQEKHKKSKVSRAEKTAMSFLTAFQLSLRNLLTKKTRTLMIAIAGSIGIIGVALVLSVANGFTGYIDKMQGDTLSAFPLTISESTYDFTSIMNMQMPVNENEYPGDKVVYINPIGEMLAESGIMVENDLTDEYIEDVIGGIDQSLYNSISYDYQVEVNIYKKLDKPVQNFYARNINDSMWSELAESTGSDEYEFLKSQYDVIDGKLPENKNEIVLVVNTYNELTDIVLMSLGIPYVEGSKSIGFDTLIGLEYKLLLNDAYYSQKAGKFIKNAIDMGPSTLITEELYNSESDDVLSLEVVGIVRPNSKTSVGSITGSIGYTKELTNFIIDKAEASQIVTWMNNNEGLDPFTGAAYQEFEGNTVESLRLNQMKNLGGIKKPVNINIYPVGFEEKELIKEYLDEQNKVRYDAAVAKYYEDNKITSPTKEQKAEAETLGKAVEVRYSDLMGTIADSMSILINAISIVLIVFTSISLVVSSIMIGVITHISVLERTKEIGILRSIGARKKDISRIFNAETIMIGFLAGLLGIIVTLVLLIPINMLLESLTTISGLAQINPWNVILLIVISSLLTFVAGLLPAKSASKKDPVIALRTE